MSEIEQLLEILKEQESRLDCVCQEQEQIHGEWQRDRGRYIRLEAQVKALLSLVSEFAAHAGLLPERVSTCFRERFLIFQDEVLQACEKASPDLAAHIDNRGLNEIPTEKKFPPLFPDE